MGGGWRKVVQNATAVTCAFALALLLYLSADYQLAGHFWISRSSVSLTYGRMAAVADCKHADSCPRSSGRSARPRRSRPWAPTGSTTASTPRCALYDETLPLRLLGEKGQFVANFNKSVERQQPLRVISGILHDSVKLFALNRHTSPGDTPIVRWQFQRHFPTVQYGPWISVRNNTIWLDLGSLQSSTLTAAEPRLRRRAAGRQADRGVPALLPAPRRLHARPAVRDQPASLGLAGSVLAFMRRPPVRGGPPGRDRLACSSSRPA